MLAPPSIPLGNALRMRRSCESAPSLIAIAVGYPFGHRLAFYGVKFFQPVQLTKPSYPL